MTDQSRSIPQNATSLDLVRRDRSVDFVEAARIMRLRTFDSHWDADAQNDTWALTEPLDVLEPRADDDGMQCFTTPPQGWTTATQRVAPWHLNVISAGGRLPRPIWGPYDYMRGAGQGVNVYVLDTGINIAHDYFGGRAENFGGVPMHAIYLQSAWTANALLRYHPTNPLLTSTPRNLCMTQMDMAQR